VYNEKSFLSISFLISSNNSSVLNALPTEGNLGKSLTMKSLRGKVIDDIVYLHPGMAHLGPKGIMVQINGEMVSVPAIQSDDYGVYVSTHYVAGRVKSGDWCCTQCWNWNRGYATECSCCGADRED
jgi:hypothetical protein